MPFDPKRNCGREAGRRCRGMALVTVLWVITLLTVIAASFALEMRREAGIVYNLQQATESRLLAEAGVRHAMIMLSHPEVEQRWLGDGRLHTTSIGGVEISLRVRHAAGYLDLNQASPELLDGLLFQVGMEDVAARERLVDNVLDWRDPSPHRRLHGDGSSGYAAAGRDHGPRNGPFPAIEDLMRVLGMNAELFRRVAPLLTVHSGQAGIDPVVADTRLLRALPGVDDATVTAFERERDLAFEQDSPAPPFPGVQGDMADSDGNTYSIESSALLPSGAITRLRVFVERSQDGISGPFVILSYRDLHLPPSSIAAVGQEP